MLFPMKKASSVNKQEVEKFSKLANRWWDISGPFKMLHVINPIRMEYICQILGTDLKGKKILDLGCGGGLVTLPLAKLGADVTGLDASEENIEAAKIKAKERKSKAKFASESIEEHKESYDVIICLEMIEHVDNVEEFITNLSKRLNKGGQIILSTLNRNIKSYLLGIGMAEYVLGWVPKGTHDFDKFLKPSELTLMLEENNIRVTDISGMSYNIINKSWSLSDDIGINYFVCGKYER